MNVDMLMLLINDHNQETREEKKQGRIDAHRELLCCTNQIISPYSSDILLLLFFFSSSREHDGGNLVGCMCSVIIEHQKSAY